MWNRIKRFLNALGPGVITGASDNDPAGVSTYSVAGASTGYTYLWLAVISVPIMIAIQGMSSRIGAARETGLGRAIQDTFGRTWFTIALIVLLISNIATIGADLAGVGAGFELLTGVRFRWFIVPVAAFIVMVQVFWSYKKFARYMKYLSLILFSYIAAGIVAAPNWGSVLHSTFIPHIDWNSTGLSVMVGVLGTTLSPYMYFWQSSEEVEEIRTQNGRQAPRTEYYRILDVITGMFYSVLIFYFVILTAASTLHLEHLYNINTAAEAARALRPIAGDKAFILFSVGIIGSGFIAIPVLAGSTAYPVSEWLGCPEGLDKPVHRARCFYFILIASVVAGIGIALSPINPITALFYSQILTGLINPVLLVLIILISRNTSFMGESGTNRPFFNIFGWIAVVLQIFADIAMIWMLLK